MEHGGLRDDQAAVHSPAQVCTHRDVALEAQTHGLSQLSTDLFETSRKDVAAFLGCREDDQVVFTRSTTDSLNLLAAALPTGTEVFVFETEHHASLLPWE